LILDNRRMGAITGLQLAQYGAECGTRNPVEIDYLAWAGAVEGVATFRGGYSPETLVEALDRAGAYAGLSLVHLPVYFGLDERGGLGAFGRWNVGNWCADTQAMRHEIGL
jgi:3D-(3,5/4)-trihydroxycyclohexane-1,2-dione acylhydrolase (decyclizing)